MAVPVGVFLDHSKHIVRKFLETVVVVDDRAELNLEHNSIPSEVKTPETEDIQPDDPRQLNRDQSIEHDTESTSQIDNRLHDFDAKQFIDACAEHDLICAVLKPTIDDITDDTFKSKIIKAARRCDILVMDWVLQRDEPEKGHYATEIIEAIVSADDDERLRLVAIYTAENDLKSIITTLHQKLTSHNMVPLEGTQAAFTITNSRVLIVAYGKEGNTGLPTDQQHRVKNTDQLPDSLIADFAHMTAGLMSNVALSSLAAIRENAHRLLVKMRPSLDAAYLAHRAMLPDPEDASEQLIDLLSAELRSILYQSQVGKEADLLRIEDWLGVYGQQLNFNNLFANNNIPPNPIPNMLALLKLGCDSKDLPEGFVNFKKAPQNKIKAELFQVSPSDGIELDKEMMILSSVTTQYHHPIPHLSMGQVLQSVQDEIEQYWLCLQPRCDSLRITEAYRAFLFIPLRLASDSDRIDILMWYRNVYLHFKIGKWYDGDMIRFAPSSDRIILAAHDKNGFFYESTDGVRYNFVGELKSDYAQDIAIRRSGEMARVALNPPEWIRRTNEQRK